MPTADRTPRRAPTPPHAAPPAPGYRALRVWQRALDVAVDAAPLARTLAAEGFGGLAADLFRAATAVPAHIAAGSTAGARVEYERALGAALAALARCETLIAAAERLAPDAAAPCAALLAGTGEVTRLLRAFARVIGGAPPAPRSPASAAAAPGAEFAPGAESAPAAAPAPVPPPPPAAPHDDRPAGTPPGDPAPPDAVPNAVPDAAPALADGPAARDSAASDAVPPARAPSAPPRGRAPRGTPAPTPLTLVHTDGVAPPVPTAARRARPRRARRAGA